MERRLDWNIERSFVRGEVYFVNLPKEPALEPDDSYVLNGEHRVIVLFDSEYPRNTVTILPISSLYDNMGNKKETIVTDCLLSLEEYEDCDQPYKGTIKKDSFVKMEQIRSISRQYLERNVGKITPEDMILIDLRLITSLQLQDTISMLIESKIQERMTSEIETEHGESN